jgi:exopolyphosphatase/guanosine-5'-triphosphate,3'-diphosphate pyrophosphatase
LIENDRIIDTYSLNLGTVRLKELFFDKGGLPIEKINKKAKKYIENELNRLPEHFKHHMVIGIGGTARTLGKSIMKHSHHALDKLHAFTYETEEHLDYLEEIPLTYAKSLKKFDIKKNRFDTIREGTLIFNAILAHIGAKTVMTSSVGVREGVFLEQMLKHENLLFPKDINPSIVSILDRFKPYVSTASTQKNRLDISLALYKTLQVEIEDELKYNKQIRDALKLTSIGNTLTIYKSHQTAFHIAMQELNYGFVHKEILLISLLLRMHGKELINEALFEQYHTLLPNKQTLRWLSFIYTLTVFIYEASHSANIVFSYGNQTLTITSDKPLYLAKEKIKILEKPVPFAIIIDDADTLPKNEELGIL